MGTRSKAKKWIVDHARTQRDRHRAQVEELRGERATLRAEVERLTAERDRLARILAVEHGRGTPDGWERDDDPAPGLHYARDGRWAAWVTWEEPGRYRWGVEDLWRLRPGPATHSAIEGSMLDAVEAAEAYMVSAAREADDG